MKVDRQNAGEAFQELTKYSRDDMPRGGLDWDARPDRHKHYEEPLAVVELPAQRSDGGGALWNLLATRRTRRTYTSEPLGIDDISQLLWAADGKTREGRDNVLRTAPSAGALYPVELYLMANRVDGLERGIYHYGVPGHTLALIRRGDYSDEAASASLGQAMLSKSAAVVFMSAVVGRSSWKYAQRAYRYVYLDAGHIAQNLCLACESMSLGVCPVGAFYDDELNAILGIDGVDETVLYAMTIGR